MTSSQNYAPWSESVEHSLRSALTELERQETSSSVLVTLPVAAFDPTFAAADTERALFLAHADGTRTLGLGVAEEFTSLGTNRFRQVRDAASRSLQRISVVNVRPCLTQSPRVYGGFAFSSRAPDELWRPFGEARFILPRYRYESSSDGASLSLLMSHAELRDDDLRENCTRTMLRLYFKLEAGNESGGLSTIPTPVTGPAVAKSDHHGYKSAWAKLVNKALTDMRNNAEEKIVVARRRQLDFQSPLGLAQTLRALCALNPDATTFCFRHGPTAFVGATPERLLRKSGLSIDTEALAGTFDASASGATEASSRPKEHAEHAPVVRAITDCLRPLCSELRYSSEPHVRDLGHLLHLRTTIYGMLRSNRHILDLVEKLHPTPAVGGCPTELACRFIDENEPEPRGWYAGPVGWFDAAGDGEFSVALRSGLICGSTAHLFAGAGLVEGSQADAEYRETELKLESLRKALREA